MKTKQKWEIELGKNGDTLTLLRARRNGKAWVNQGVLPKTVRDFCCVSDASGTVDAKWSDIVEHATNEKGWKVEDKGRTARLLVEIDFPAEAKGIEPGQKARVARLEAALKAASEGRNESCWPLYSFGWKDADLEPDGCTGIKQVIRADSRYVVLEVGGHKTVCDPTYECEWDLTEEDRNAYSEVAHSIVCDGPAGEWTGDDWCLSERTSITVKWRGNVLATAAAVIKKARKAIKSFEESCRMVDDDMNKLYEELRQKYEKAS